VVHFFYFYVLWVTIQFAFKAPGFAAEHGWLGVAGLYLEAFWQPFGTLWFIYLLPIFFVVTKLIRGVPPLAVWLVAAALEIAPIETGSVIIDEFAFRFVYFYSGYILAPRIFAFAASVQAKPALALGGLLGWALINQAFVGLGLADLPVLSLALGALGATAVVAISALLARSDLFAALRYCGQNSLVIYLAFFLPMVISRTALLKTGIITDIGTIALIVTLAGVVGALVLYWMLRNTALRFLFERPARFWLTPRSGLRLQPAE
jgi:uncharacterized membrane protein YcfT